MATYFFAMIGKVLAEFSIFIFALFFNAYGNLYISYFFFAKCWLIFFIKCLLAGIWVGLAFYFYVGSSYK